MVSFALDSAQLAHTYDRVSDKQFQHGKLLLLDLALHPGEAVLDVGCGTGRLSAYAAGLVAPHGLVHAVDPLPLRVEVARARARSNLYASVASAEKLWGFDAGTFDAVYFNSVMHWVEDKVSALEEARRVLKRGGRLGISMATSDAPHDLERVLAATFAHPELGHGGEVPSGTPHRISAGVLRDLLSRAGFVSHRVELRTFTDYFRSADEVVEFNLASSFGNFWSHLSEEQRKRALAAFSDELERWRTADGIQLQRHLIFATAHVSP